MIFDVEAKAFKSFLYGCNVLFRSCSFRHAIFQEILVIKNYGQFPTWF
eukprot:11982.XXX_449544_449687_1 [CDS] Oithona nana genome sequencing.